MIKNKASVNEEASGNLDSLKREITRLKEELAMSKYMVSEMDQNKTMSGRKLDTAVGVAFDDKTIEEQRQFLIEQNKNQLELEILLKESLVLLTENEQKIVTEINKKEEFMNIMRQAAS